MRWFLAACLVLLPRVTLAQENPPFSFPYFTRTLVGAGGAPRLPKPFVTLTAELGQHPLTGALLTGISISTATQGREWSATTAGIFARVDLTYLFWSRLWTVPPSPSPIHLQLGSRVGMGVSQSFRDMPSIQAQSDYTLVRPELQSTLDCEWWPFDAAHYPRGHHFGLMLRGAVDTPVDLSQVFRWSVATGVHYGWGGE